MTSLPPSGRQLELVHDDSTATVVEVGGGLRDYRVGGVPVLDGYPVEAMASHGRGQLLVPWPNRVAGGRYRFGDETLQLAISEAKTGNAIHGLGRWISWDLERISPAAASASCVVRAQSGYPFTIAFTASYVLSDEGLAVTMTATNLTDGPAPVGMGAHPYLLCPGPGGQPTAVEDTRLTIPAERWLQVNESLIPVGDESVAGTPFDFRVSRAVGTLPLDTCFAGLVRDDDGGMARVVLTAPPSTDGSVAAVTLWMDETWQYIQVFTGDTLPGDERRRSIAVEPQTCPADAFNNGKGLRVLGPGESFGGTWGISPRL